MNYKEIFETPILDDLFNSRSDGFETEIIKAKRKNNEDADLYKQAQLNDSLMELVSNHVTDVDIKKQILEILREYDDAYNEDIYYWIKEYYKLGFCDGMNLKKEISELEAKLNGKNN